VTWGPSRYRWARALRIGVEALVVVMFVVVVQVVVVVFVAWW
jgi:hypothetical protein